MPEAEFVAYGDAHVAYSELGMAKTPEGNIAWRWLSEDDSHALGEIEEYELEITRDGVYTIYELKLPWKEVLPQGATISEDRPLGFSLLVNDNDGSGRRGWIEYASGIGLSKDSTLFTYLKLIK